jgi:hypothetical protein
VSHRAAFAVAVSALALSAACALTVGGEVPFGTAARADDRGEPRPCLVDGLASSPGAERCFFDQIKICDASGVWTSKAVYSAELCRAQRSAAPGASE